MIYYIYVYLREDGSPYYVGKGCNGRWNNSLHNCEVPPPDRVIFPITQTTEEWAFFMEMKLIDDWGRLDDGTGILENKTDGGDAPPKNSKDKDQTIRQQKRREFYKRNPDKLKEYGDAISIGKKKNAHITSQQVKERHQSRTFYTEEGYKKLMETCRNNCKKQQRKVLCVETGETWAGLKEFKRQFNYKLKHLSFVYADNKQKIKTPTYHIPGVYCVEMDKYWISVGEAELELGIKNITRVCSLSTPQYKTTKGLTFRYVCVII